MTPKEKAMDIFKSIRQMDNDSGKNCTTCDCVVLPIAKFICDEMLKMHEEYKLLSDEGPLDFIGTGSVASMKAEQKEYEENWKSKKKFWQEVKTEIEKL